MITVELTEPPYHIHDSGYASFGLKIDVFFRTPVNPKERQIHYEYDLFLPGVGQPTVSSFKTERLQFINPPPTFRAMLIAGGAVSVFSCKLTSHQEIVNNSVVLHPSILTLDPYLTWVHV